MTNGWDIFSDILSNKLTDKALKFLKKHVGSDLFIVCGDGGVGKSSFIKSITGEDVYIGSTLESGTRVTALVPAVINDKRCLFLDMPGFNTVDFDNWDVFFRLMAAMSVVQSYVEFRGVLFVDSFSRPRVSPSAKILLTWLSLFCGLEYMPNVAIVTTRWDGLDADGVAEKLKNVEDWKKSWLAEMTSKGAAIYHHGLIDKEPGYQTLHINRDASERQTRARRFIGTHYRGSTDLKLQIYIEIANGATLETTRAGRWLKYGNTSSGTADAQEERSSNSSGTGQGNFWDNVKWEDMQRWARLLYQAGRFFMSANARRSPSFGEFDEEFDYQPFYEAGFSFNDSWDDIFNESPVPESPPSSSTCSIL
ncbi:hypothetical protein N7468_009703 [Penicillium chermesinum]|uniref:G domain-containing protein n=1 Tax=Penicillium chermesinum TaxID=63820 RepID=A0A9W9NIB8_9EURO|nr:uncharacterized protein N7468_009703 [Penicillium chermesinum]KAJ5220499.1 hypothetical protein N7468_009703 [Penicillium chermesinum]KAJ6157934.1 hypothetical protein N7470_005526 [Penicillium chermesinum]